MPEEKIDKMDFVKKLEEKWTTWTGIENPEIGDALKDLSGNLYHELRKFEAILLGEVDRRGYPAEFKDFIKLARTETWKGILGKQKVGMDKMCIIVARYVEETKQCLASKK